MKSMPKILITGAHGFLGARAMARFPAAMTLDSRLLRQPGLKLRETVKELRPDIIINAAAISDIGACEKDPEGSYQANVLLPVDLARAAEEMRAKLISFSSDQVYTGCTEKGPYQEELVLPAPGNLYARHKLEAEQRVLDLHPAGIMLRATWMYDLPLYGYSNRGNFLVNTMNALMQGKAVSVPGKQYRGITYVRPVVDLLDQVFGLPGGVYNYGSENPLTMQETAEALLNELGVNGQVQDTDAVRHNLWMDCSKLKGYGICFDTTQEGFRRCIQDYQLR